MLFTTHALAGAAIGMATGDPYAGFALGFASHHAMDSLPHFDQGTFYTPKTRVRWLGVEGEYHEHHGFSRRDWTMLFIDWALAGVLFSAVAFAVPIIQWPAIIGGTLGGLMPDIIDSSPLWSEKLRAKFAFLRRYHKFHGFFHWTVSMPYIWLGIVTQFCISAVSFSYLLGWPHF